MTYPETIDFLFSQLAMYQAVGPAAYKPGIGATLALDAAFGSPSRRFAAIHVGGTNGKGSTAHSIAAVLAAAGLRVGLFTSPHLLDFRERIRIDGKMIPEEEVTAFVERYRAMAPIADAERPSFFELTTVMAFEWFARQEVDVAVIEVGLGGRLDSTNILPSPLMTIVTNISLDHTALLGSTPEAIAAEKAGIFKPGVPAIVGSAEGAVREVFERRAAEVGAPLEFADTLGLFAEAIPGPDAITYTGTPYGTIACDLTGDCQPANMATILAALRHLPVGPQAVARGLAAVASTTGLMGRWMTVGTSPRVVTDTGHNPGGWAYLAPRLGAIEGHKEIVLGFVADKDLSAILTMIAREVGSDDVTYRFTQPSTPRALPAAELAAQARAAGLRGDVYPTVADAYAAALAAASPADTIFVGGSTFVVADLLAALRQG